MAIRVFRVGNRIRITGAFAGPDKTPADPDIVTVSVETPDGAITTLSDPDVVRDSTGNYHADWDCEIPGDHHWRWVGTGSLEAAGGGVFTVRGAFG
jgi:hypothetical protein